MLKRKNRLIGLDPNITFADNTSAKANLKDLIEKSDFFAFNYGLGGCKTLSEFVDMINQEDPLLIEVLLRAATNRINASNGKKDGMLEIDPTISKISNVVATEKNILIAFLRDMGADQKELNEAIKRIDSGQIQVPVHDYSWITSEKLLDPKFPIQEVLDQMKEDEKRSIKINVSADTLLGKKKRK